MDEIIDYARLLVGNLFDPKRWVQRPQAWFRISSLPLSIQQYTDRFSMNRKEEKVTKKRRVNLAKLNTPRFRKELAIPKLRIVITDCMVS